MTILTHRRIYFLFEYIYNCSCSDDSMIEDTNKSINGCPGSKWCRLVEYYDQGKFTKNESMNAVKCIYYPNIRKTYYIFYFTF